MQVLLFASYAEQAGRSTVALTLPGPATVQDVLRQLRASLPGADRLPEQPLAAVNQVHARLSSPVQDGDEIAFLPPLAGG
ncbi:MAG TPA: MoaD/ThiS family protein [Gemmatimonadales bacterium]|nr:MoaD/ThiS family protein [Gemmatimonadales bacterium]